MDIKTYNLAMFYLGKIEECLVDIAVKAKLRDVDLSGYQKDMADKIKASIK